MSLKEEVPINICYNGPRKIEKNTIPARNLNFLNFYEHLWDNKLHKPIKKLTKTLKNNYVLLPIKHRQFHKFILCL